MDNIDISTEEKIIQAAESEFIEKGMAGARMQEIANKAGINKALLHYYFRSKEKLFDVIFSIAFKTFFPQFQKIINDDLPLFEKIEQFAFSYIDFIIKHPHIPGFVMYELNHNPKNLSKHIGKIDFKNTNLYQQINEEVGKGNIRPIIPEQLVINILSLIVFPILAKPIIKTVLFDSDETKYIEAVIERKKLVAEFVINAIRV